MFRFDCQFLMATFVNVYIHSFINTATPGKVGYMFSSKFRGTHVFLKKTIFFEKIYLLFYKYKIQLGSQEIMKIAIFFIDVTSSYVVCTQTQSPPIYFSTVNYLLCASRCEFSRQIFIKVNSRRIWSKAVRILVLAVASCPNWILMSAVASCFDAEARRAAGAVPPPGGFAICARHSRPACLKTTWRAEDPETYLKTYKLVVPLRTKFFWFFIFTTHKDTGRQARIINKVPLNLFITFVFYYHCFLKILKANLNFFFLLWQHSVLKKLFISCLTIIKRC